MTLYATWQEVVFAILNTALAFLVWWALLTFLKIDPLAAIFVAVVVALVRPIRPK